MQPMIVRGSEGQSVTMAAGAARKTLGWGEHTLLSEVVMDKGGLVPLHSHPHEQIGYVTRGALEFTIGDQTVVLRAGDGYAIPGNVVHAVRALEDSAAVDVFSPVREEYKPGRS
jgi:quercetin dioxygenase-like cupin family protein